MTIGDFQVSRNTAGYGKSLSLSLSGIFSPIIVVENMQHFVKKKTNHEICNYLQLRAFLGNDTCIT